MADRKTSWLIEMADGTSYEFPGELQGHFSGDFFILSRQAQIKPIPPAEEKRSWFRELTGAPRPIHMDITSMSIRIFAANTRQMRAVHFPREIGGAK